MLTWSRAPQQRMDRGRTTLGTVCFKYPSHTIGCNQSARAAWPEVATASGKRNWHLPDSWRVVRAVFRYVALQEIYTLWSCDLCCIAFVHHVNFRCPIDELIRQITINCGERGLLLLRVRDDIRMTIAAYQTLYESSIAFGMRKALMAEQRKRNMEARVCMYHVYNPENDAYLCSRKCNCDVSFLLTIVLVLAGSVVVLLNFIDGRG